MASVEAISVRPVALGAPRSETFSSRSIIPWHLQLLQVVPWPRADQAVAKPVLVNQVAEEIGTGKGEPSLRQGEGLLAPL